MIYFYIIKCPALLWGEAQLCLPYVCLKEVVVVVVLVVVVGVSDKCNLLANDVFPQLRNIIFGYIIQNTHTIVALVFYQTLI